MLDSWTVNYSLEISELLVNLKSGLFLYGLILYLGYKNLFL